MSCLVHSQTSFYANGFLFIIAWFSATRSQATRRVRGMMMSGKQYSLDSRIDLVEAVQASQDEEDQENVTRTQDKEDTGMKI